MKSIAWALCFLEAPNPVYDAFSTLGKMLRLAGMELIIFGPAADYGQYDGFQHFDMPFSLVEQGNLYRDFLAQAGLPMTAASVQELVSIEREWIGISSEVAAELGVLRALAFWERAREILQPALILSWGTTCPLSRLFLRLAQQSQTPAYCVERGFFENTLAFNLVGQCALTNASLELKFVSPDPFSSHLMQKWTEIESYYNKNGDRHYPFSNLPLAEKDYYRINESESPSVLFIGSFDLGAGISFTQPKLEERYGTWIKTSAEAAAVVAKALYNVHSGAALWIKGHPATPLTDVETPVNLSVQYFEQTDIQELVEACDICVTLGSTAQMYALLKGKPLITLSNSLLIGRDVAYEAHSAADVELCLRAALAAEDWPLRLATGRALVAALYDQDLIGLNDGTPCRYGLKDLAKLMGRFSNYQRISAGETEERLTLYRDFLSQARAGRTPEALILRDQNVALQNQLHEAHLQAEALKATLAEVGTDRESLARQVEELQRYSLKYENRLAAAVAESRSAVAALDEHNALRVMLSTKLAAANANADSMARQIELQENEICRLTSLLQETQTLLTAKEADIERLAAGSQVSAERLRPLNACVADLEAALLGSISALDVVLDARRTSETQLEQMHDKYSILENSYAELGEAIRDFSASKLGMLYHLFNKYTKFAKFE